MLKFVLKVLSMAVSICMWIITIPVTLVVAFATSFKDPAKSKAMVSDMFNNTKETINRLTQLD